MAKKKSNKRLFGIISIAVIATIALVVIVGTQSEYVQGFLRFKFSKTKYPTQVTRIEKIPQILKNRGEVVFAFSANNPPIGNIEQNELEHDFLGFTINTTTEAVIIKDLQIDINYSGGTDINNLEVLNKDSSNNWIVLEGPLDPTSGGCLNGLCEIDFQHTLNLSANSSNEYKITIDTNNAVINDEYSVNLDYSNITATYTTDMSSVSTSSISGGNIHGNTQTVIEDVRGQVAFALSADNPPMSDVGQNESEHEFLGFRIDTTDEDIVVEDLQIDINYSGGTDIGNLEVWGKNASNNWVVLVGPLDPTVFSCLNGLCEVDLNHTFTLASNSINEYMVKMDTMSAATNDEYSVNLDYSNMQAVYGNNDPVQNSAISGGDVHGNTQAVL